MTKRSLLLIGCVAVGFILLSCAGPSSYRRDSLTEPTRLEKDFGRSFEHQKVNQIANPDAEKDLGPVTGLDGKAAEATIEKYRKEFEKPAPPPAYVLGVGSISNRE